MDSGAKSRQDTDDPDSHLLYCLQLRKTRISPSQGPKPLKKHRKRPGLSWSTEKTTSFSWICDPVHRFLRGGTQTTICAAETSTQCSLVAADSKCGLGAGSRNGDIKNLFKKSLRTPFLENDFGMFHISSLQEEMDGAGCCCACSCEKKWHSDVVYKDDQVEPPC